MKTLEIFSGAGGLAKGLELSGFEHTAFVEFNRHACASLSENFDPTRVFFGDIKDFPDYPQPSATFDYTENQIKVLKSLEIAP